MDLQIWGIISVAFDTLVVLLSILAGLFAPSFKRMDCNQQIASKRVVACHDTVLFRNVPDWVFGFVVCSS